MQNCAAILQSRKKATEGFFPGRLRERCLFFLAKKQQAMEGGFAGNPKNFNTAVIPGLTRNL